MNPDEIFALELLAEKKEEERKDRMKYGRYWVWESYFSEKINQVWLDCADDLNNVNDQVLEDIQDYIMLKAFKGLSSDKIKRVIEEDN